jgi:hypothetical protein
MTRGKTWRGAHLFYHEEDLDLLVLEVVRPLFERAGAELGERFFVRHWQRGPHVRVWFRVGEPVYSARLRPLFDEVAGEFFARNPSRSVLDERQLRPLHELLARREQVSGELFPLMPNNSVQHLAYESRAAVLGGRGAEQLIGRFYVETNDLVFAMLDRIRAGADRLWLAMGLMFAHAEAAGPGIERGFISYRSHAEGFILGTSRPDQVRAQLGALYEADREALDSRLHEVLGFMREGRGEEPFVAEWNRVVTRFRPLCEKVVRSGDVRLPGINEPVPDGSRGLMRDRLGYSAFHSYLTNTLDYRDRLYGSPWFHTFRLLVNLLYLHLARLGIAPRQRYTLCHLAASAVESSLGVTALDLIAGRIPRT